MRNINYIIKGAMPGGMVLALSASPALAFGENKVVNEKAKVEINKVEKNKVDKAMLEEKKVEELMVMKLKSNSDLVHKNNPLGIHRNLLLDEDLLGEGLLGIEE
jgi:hypothetical protein